MMTRSREFPEFVDGVTELFRVFDSDGWMRDAQLQ